MIAAIVQARMGSSRLPGKVLEPILDQPMLGHVVTRLKQAATIDAVIVATTTAGRDAPIEDFCRTHGVSVYRGSEADVLDRYYQAAKECGADVIVRVTADCPLLDPRVVDKVVTRFLQGDVDYASNTLRCTYPDGLDVEVCSMAALERAWKEATRPVEREHVTPYLKQSDKFRTVNVEHDEDLSPRDLRWTVDRPEDLAFVRQVFRQLSADHGIFHLEDVLALLKRRPDLLDVNEGQIRNEGYYLTLLRDEPPAPVPARSLERSLAWKARAEAVVPSLSQTFSKNPTQFVQNVSPLFLERGEGCRVWDVDGNEYIDYAMGLGPVILGYNHPAVTEAVIRQVKDGTAFTLPHPLEVEVSELIVDLVPCAEMVRFGKNGSDVTAGAVRAARAYTGRDVIACCGYHGWQDWYIGTTTRNKGVPAATAALTAPFEYNNLGSLETLFAAHPGKIAGVILEPMGVIPPAPGFLEGVRDLCTRHGAVLIFDEVITGFRWALGGAQEYFKVTPDLACFGKALANGFPLSAVAGKRAIMALFDEIFFSFTFGGETASLAAAKATLTVMRGEGIIPRLWETGKILQDGFTVLARELGVASYLSCAGFPVRTVVTFKDEGGQESLLYKSYFQQECIKRGVLFGSAHNICAAHRQEDIERTLVVYRDAMKLLAEGIQDQSLRERLEGPPVQPVFRRA